MWIRIIIWNSIKLRTDNSLADALVRSQMQYIESYVIEKPGQIKPIFFTSTRGRGPKRFRVLYKQICSTPILGLYEILFGRP